ncbi:TPA: LPXTG cell wall anchor domain-containing protein [Streptococcus suis]
MSELLSDSDITSGSNSEIGIESTNEILSENSGFPQSELASESLPEPVFPLPPSSAGKQFLPNTGEQSSAWSSLLGAVLLFGGLFKRRKKQNEEESED